MRKAMPIGVEDFCELRKGYTGSASRSRNNC